ncbi:MAG: tRNA (adenosine(37)-N6)-threonylcarbamoyltransferase complex ATPase subunit type 1 TsaE [Roseomonas sp.]|nr:tRNA (adenosine(37)-N6)-threonylcarbamoyltransferase complex ATPase subunit type 1 TsaE [Roseomonas sp.]MCA3388027.1 tRNA (adenosine(37)-N6)-threonylcarbamoyltransferase complex ATPase subunit type 1 TsaE [Roseomonas sp.]MCA3392662.1 tRNA (adenosine(37)-N6)-threonylcarbamoyltransferase complex ATPase subunit type 1 TsaE [Roseomonas sp.]MCA3407812.1 tRNA (adenosine(37)-N6)-threonylcarbamoyltransferase complex ATPase subunit type 1 TsaE [Roseomonas sp.]
MGSPPNPGGRDRRNCVGFKIFQEKGGRRPVEIALDLPDLAATEALAARLAPMLRPGDAVLLNGPLGAGKSAFARALLRAATGDPRLEVPSPTFTLVQSYDLPACPAHHFDLYRLSGPEGLAELGWEEAREGIVLVEWPERLGPLAPRDALRIHLTPGAAEEARRVVLRGWDTRLEGLRP